MAIHCKRKIQSARGRFFVDNGSCVHCELCNEIAPDYFTHLEDGQGAVYRQPKSTGEIQLCRYAKACCPVGAINDRRDLLQMAG